MMKLDSTLFNWSRWRRGDIHDFVPACRFALLKAKRMEIKKYTVGYCDAENLNCRPKINHKAVMFFKDGEHFWFHLRNEEFKLIYET